MSSSLTMQPADLDPGEFRPLGEELNFATHLLGAVLSVIGAAVLLHAMWHTPDTAKFVGCAAYVASLVAVYTASALSHAFHRPRLRHFFRTLDQVCIFFLIAGSTTPWAVVYFPDRMGTCLLVALWLLAAVGAFFKLFVRQLNNVTTVAYVAMGWLPVLMIKPILERVPWTAFAWLAAGGLLYTVGTFFLVRDYRNSYYHAIWHLLVIAASACHFAAVMLYIVPGA